MKVNLNIPLAAVDKNKKEYAVTEISMGGYRTTVSMIEKQESYNSVDYKFYVEGKEVNIYKSSLFNPYINDYENLICFEEVKEKPFDKSVPF